VAQLPEESFSRRGDRYPGQRVLSKLGGVEKTFFVGLVRAHDRSSVDLAPDGNNSAFLIRAIRSRSRVEPLRAPEVRRQPAPQHPRGPLENFRKRSSIARRALFIARGDQSPPLLPVFISTRWHERLDQSSFRSRAILERASSSSRGRETPKSAPNFKSMIPDSSADTRRKRHGAVVAFSSRPRASLLATTFSSPYPIRRGAYRRVQMVHPLLPAV